MKNKKTSYFYLAIIILLLLVIIWLLIPKKENLKATGNVDIFEIKCDCDDSDSKYDQKNNDDSPKNDIIPVINNGNKNNTKDDKNDEPDLDEGKFVVKAKFNWENNQKINIFANPLYDMNNIIAPGSTNTYKFMVKNSTEYNLKYTVSFVEENEFNINMKYRLKKEDGYLLGDDDNWVLGNDLTIENVNFNKKTTDTYYLEWKWFESDNDTVIGKMGSVKYNLKINVKAEEIDEN